MIKRLIIGFLLVISYPILGQRYIADLENINATHGLPDNSVYTIFQDSKGFIWIGTHTSLARYDGYNFKEYKINERDEEATPVIKIVSDDSGNLWVATLGAGLHLLNAEEQELTRYTQNDTENQFGNNILDILVRNGNEIWIVTESGVFINQKKVSRKFEQVHFINNEEQLIRGITEIEKSGDELLTLSTNNGLLYQSKISSSFSAGKILSSEIIHQGSAVGNLFFNDVGNTLWMSSWNNGLFGAKNGSLFKSFTYSDSDRGSISSNQITDIARDPLGRTWVATYDRGINILSSYPDSEKAFFINTRSSTRLDTYQSTSEVLDRLNDYHIRSLFFDRTGVLWMATENSGILKLEFRRETFRYFQQDSHVDNTLAHRDVSFPKITKNGSLWIGTWGGGLHYLSPEEMAKNSPGYKRFFPIDGDTTSISFTRVFPVFEDKDENLWLGTNGGGLNLLVRDERTKTKPKFRRYQVDSTRPGAINNNSIRSIFQDATGSIWIGTDTGLNKYIPGRNRFEHFLEEFLIYEIDEDQSGNLWLGTRHNGLVVWNPKSDTYIKHDHFLKGDERIELTELHHVAVGENGNIWFGGRNGFFSFDPATKQFTQFTEEDGIPTRQLESIEIDQKGRLWIGTWETGLYLFEPETQTFTSFKMTQGSMGNSFTQGASQAPDGTLYFGSRNGFYKFHPDSIRIHNSLPDVQITAVQGGETIIPPAQINDLNNKSSEIRLGYRDKMLSISFASLSFNISQPVRYTYSLSGVDEKPNITNIGQNNVSYSNLKPGTYTFSINAFSQNSSSVIKEIIITIRPPWWRTWWSYAGMTFLTILVIGWIIRSRKIGLEREKRKFRLKVEREKEERLQEMKMEFFTNISHEIKTPLTLIKAPIENILSSKDISSENIRYASLVKSNTERLLRLTNQLLDYRKLSLSQMPINLENIDLVTTVESVCKLFSELALKNRIALDFKSKPSSIICMLDRDKIESIIFNLLTNAIKHTPNEGLVRVSVELSNNNAIIKIKDTGSGISKEKIDKVFETFYSDSDSSIQKGTGIGLPLVKGLVELMKGDIKVESQQLSGTCFIVTIPIEIASKKGEEKHFTISGSHHVNSSSSDWKHNGKKNNTKPTLLIAEDDEQMNNYIVMQFENDYNIVQAFDGQDAYQKAAALLPDLIISDLMMPELNGIELTQKLKTELDTSHIPIVLLTAKSDHEDKLRGIETGADTYLTKPFSTELLTVTVSKLIENRRLLRQKYSQSTEIEPSGITITSVDEQFIRRILEIIDANLDNSALSVEEVSKEIGVSTPQLYRKTKAITGLSPNEFIRTHRIKRAAILLKETGLTISEISYRTGFNNPKYFSRCFSQQLGTPPSRFRTSYQTQTSL